MKGTLKSFKKVLRESLAKQLEDLDRERRASQGEYENEDDMAGVSYGDRYGEAVEIETEDTDRVRRHNDGYGDDMEEATPPGPSPRAGMKPPHKGPGDEDPFKALGATGASQLSKGTAAAAAKSDPKMVSKAAVDAVMKILGPHNPSTRATTLNMLKQALGPGGSGMQMPSMESLTSELDEPPADDEKKKSRGKGHAAPLQIDVGDTGGGPPGMFLVAGLEPDDEEDERRLGSTFGGDDQSTMDSQPQLAGYDPIAGDDPKMRTQRREDDYDVDSEVAPPGKEDMVKALKKDADVDNPFAVAWAAHSKAKLKGRRGR